MMCTKKWFLGSRFVSSRFVYKGYATTPSGLAFIHISSIIPSKALNPWYITGFSDGR